MSTCTLYLITPVFDLYVILLIIHKGNIDLDSTHS